MQRNFSTHLLWYNASKRIGRTLLTLEEVEKAVGGGKGYKEVELWSVIKKHPLEDMYYACLSFNPVEIMQSLYFITGKGKPICYIPTIDSAPCYITAEGMTGGVVIAPCLSC